MFHEQFHSPSHFQAMLNPMALVPRKYRSCSQRDLRAITVALHFIRESKRMTCSQHLTSTIIHFFPNLCSSSYLSGDMGNTLLWFYLPSVNCLNDAEWYQAIGSKENTCSNLMNIKRKKESGPMSTTCSVLAGQQRSSTVLGAWPGSLSESTSVDTMWCFSQLRQLVGNKVLEW